MMNVVALMMLLSSLGSAIVLSPEPVLVKSASEEGGEGAIQAVKDAAHGSFQKAEEMVVDGVTKPLETGFGWFRRKSPPTPEDRLNAAREKAAEAREAFQEASAQLKEAAIGKAGETARETGTYVGDKASQAVGTAKGAAGKAEEWVEDGAHEVYDKAVDVKDGAYDAAAAAKDKTVTKTKEGVEDTYESAAETLSSAKDKALGKLGGEKQKVSLLAENARDVVVDDLQLGLDKTKTTATDAAEKVKDTAETAALETKETAQGILGKVKDAACYTAECIRSRAQEAGSFLPRVGQGVGYVYNDNGAGADDTAAAAAASAGSLKEKASDTVGEIGERAREGARDARETAGRYYQEGRDRYESGRETAREYYDDAGRRYRRARDYYDHGPSGDSYAHRGRNYGRNRYTGTRDPASRYYEEAEDFFDHGFKDRARFAYRNERDQAGDYYDDVKGYAGTPGHRRDHYYSSSRRRTRDSNSNSHSRNRGEDLDHDLVPELVEVVESMGWIRAGKVPKGYVSVASPKEVVIGDVKYVLPQAGKAAGQQHQPPSDETVIQHVTNSVKGAAHNVGERLGFVKDKARESAENQAENVRGGAGRVKDQVYETLRDGRSWSGRPFYQGRHSEGDHGEESEDDDSLLTKGVRNLKEGVRTAGHVYEQERSKAGEYADNARRELSSFAGYHGEDHGSDRNLSRRARMRSWKDVFTRKPVGLLLALARALHLFTFSTVYGSAFWVTFVSGMILSKHVPRQQFGYVQSRMFPVYLRVLAVGQGVLLLLQLLLHPWGSADSGERAEVLIFLGMIVTTLINASFIEPNATKAMFERLKVEKEEGRGLENAETPSDAKQLMDEHKKRLHAITQQFKSLHGVSSALNLVSLGGLTCHVWHLANRLVV